VLAFVHNLRRGHYEPGSDVNPKTGGSRRASPNSPSPSDCGAIAGSSRPFSGDATGLLTEICEPSKQTVISWISILTGSGSSSFSVNETRDGQHHQNDNHHDDDLDEEGERIAPTHHPTVSELR